MAAIVVTGRDARISTREKRHAEEKLGKLERYFDGIHQIETASGSEDDNLESYEDIVDKTDFSQ